MDLIQMPLLTLGILVHGVLLLWSYDMYAKSEHSDVTCPILRSNNAENPTRLIIFAVLRANDQRGAIKGTGNEFFRRIPNVIFIGESSVPEYYENSENWLKFTYEESWDSIDGDFNFVLNSFRENFVNSFNRKTLYVLVFRNKQDEKNILYLNEQLEIERKSFDERYQGRVTTVLLFSEPDRVLITSGVAVNQVKNKLIRNADMGPLISTLLGVDIPYQSLGLVPVNFIKSTADTAVAKYCNALNIVDLAEDARKNAGLLKYFLKTTSGNELVKLTNTIETLFMAKNYTGASYLSQNLIASKITTYINSKQLMASITFTVLVLSVICWLMLLCFEYVQLASSVVITENISYLTHFCFFLTALVLICLPFVQHWSFTYIFYFQMPVLLLWLISMKIKGLFRLKLEPENLNQFLHFSLVTIFTVEYLLIDENIVTALSVCLLALYPSLPKFRSVPFLFIYGWHILSMIILGLVYLNLVYDIEPSTKYINFSGTIWLLISGIAVLWIQPKIDKVIVSFLTICMGATMWLQNVCLTLKVHCQILLYFTWPFFAIILVPVFGKTGTLKKLVQCTLTLAVPVLLMSTKLEAIALLVLLGFTASWASIEMCNVSVSTDNLRRMVMLVYLMILSDKLTATDQLSLRCFLCHIFTNSEIYIPLLKLIRLSFIFASILTTFRLILGSTLDCYLTALLTAIVFAVASLRVLIPLAVFSFDTIELDHLLYRFVHINSMALVFIPSYMIAIIYARNNKQIVSMLPPLQQSTL